MFTVNLALSAFQDNTFKECDATTVTTTPTTTVTSTVTTTVTSTVTTTVTSSQTTTPTTTRQNAKVITFTLPRIPMFIRMFCFVHAPCDFTTH